MRTILGVFAVGSFVTVCVACGDSEGGVSETTDTGGRASGADTGGRDSDTGGTAPAGGTATGGTATGGTVPATFGGFESTGGRSSSGGSGPTASGGSRPTASGGSRPTASGGSSPTATGGASSGECEPLPTPEAPAYDGDFEIANAADAEEARKYSEFTGSLTIGVPELELPTLARVGGDLSSLGTTTLRLPALTEVGGRVYYYLDAAIQVLDLRSLQSVGGEFYVHRNSGLIELQIDALVESGAGSHISANLKLPDCYLDVVDAHIDVLHTVAPEDCVCMRNCGVVAAECGD